MNLSYSNKLIGFDKEFAFLINLYDKKKLPNKLLFSGRKGIGKSTLALHLINYLLENKNDDNKYNLIEHQINTNNREFNLIHNNSHPNFIRIIKNSEKKTIEISQVKEILSFVNKSSFNNKLKIVLIEDVENLSSSSGNSLLKIMEESDNKILFILVYNNSKYLLETIKSRCIEFKLFLKTCFIENIVNHYFNKEIYTFISSEFKNNYMTPSDFINLINYCSENQIDLNNISLDKFIKNFIDKSLYKKDNSKIIDMKLYIEILLYKKNFYNKTNNFYNLVNHLNTSYRNIIKYNLDIEPYFFEINNKLLNEK